MKTAPLVLALLLAGPAALAGTEIATATRDAGDDATPEKGRVLFDGRLLRVDAGPRRSIVYRGDKGLVWIIDHKRKRYLELQQPSPELVAQQARARLEALDDDERAAARETAEAIAEGAFRVRDTGETERLLGIPCREISVDRNGERLADLCKAGFSEAGIPPENLQALRELQVLLDESLAAALAQDPENAQLAAALASVIELDGLPLRVRAYKKGRLRSETLVTRVAERSLPDGEFGIPEGYRAKIRIQIRKSIKASQ